MVATVSALLAGLPAMERDLSEVKAPGEALVRLVLGQTAPGPAGGEVLSAPLAPGQAGLQDLGRPTPPGRPGLPARPRRLLRPSTPLRLLETPPVSLPL